MSGSWEMEGDQGDDSVADLGDQESSASEGETHRQTDELKRQNIDTNKLARKKKHGKGVGGRHEKGYENADDEGGGGSDDGEGVTAPVYLRNTKVALRDDYHSSILLANAVIADPEPPVDSWDLPVEQGYKNGWVVVKDIEIPASTSADDAGFEFPVDCVFILKHFIHNPGRERRNGEVFPIKKGVGRSLRALADLCDEDPAQQIVIWWEYVIGQKERIALVAKEKATKKQKKQDKDKEKEREKQARQQGGKRRGKKNTGGD